MKARCLSVLAALLAMLSITPAFSQVCSQSKYANTIACLPTLVASSSTSAQLNSYYANGREDQHVNIPSGDIYYVSSPLALGSQYASQIATSPSAATSAGYVFTFSKGALTAKPADLGPLFSDLPQTIGRNRFYVGTAYQWMEINKLGGQNANSLPLRIPATATTTSLLALTRSQ